MVDATIAQDGVAEDLRLLMLDDDPELGETAVLMAERIGVSCRATVDAASFYATLKKWKPTHIALDLAMPDEDGIEIIRRLAEIRCRCAIILISGLDSRVLEAARRAAENHGLLVVGALAKPFSMTQMREMLRIVPVSPRAVQAIASLEERQLPRVNRAMLRRAIDEDQIDVAFQPKVRCIDGSLAGFEALARWSHPVHGSIPPDRFIGVAERSDLLGRLTETIFDKAFAWHASLARPGVGLALNVSAKSLADIGLADHIAEASDRFGIDPKCVILEVTESSAIYDQTAALDLLIRLRLKGFRLSIDDFGVGYSSLSQLARMPFSELKIDRSFVSSTSHSAELRSIVRGIVGLAKSLGLLTVAEGVEDLATFRFLREAGCDEAQGYLIGRPMSRKDLGVWLGDRSQPMLATDSAAEGEGQRA